MATPDSSSAPVFGTALRGYDRASVDAYVVAAAERTAALSAEVAELRAALVAAEPVPVTLGERASDLLRSADFRAGETIELATRGELGTTELYERTRTECETLLTAAQVEADQIVSDAQQQAATINERARQEFAWRRRQVRKEQDLVDLRKQQIVHQIVTLNALAAKTADTPVELSEARLDQLSEQHPVAVPAG